MCGRFASTQPSQVIREAFHAYLGKAEARPSFNVAPSQQARVVRRHPASGENSLDDLAWGLIPHCADSDLSAHAFQREAAH
jgi:putative SOS response-associated peptidase YedK